MTTGNRKFKKTLLIFLYVLIGIIIGAYLFNDTQPRSFLTFHRCNKTCLEPQEFIGLLNSVIIQKTPNLIPKIIIETDKSIAIEHPAPQSPIHYVVFPKRDIKDFGQLSNGDEEYVLDMLSVLSQLIRENNLKDYQIISNGPGYQFSNYLHFHLRSFE